MQNDSLTKIHINMGNVLISTTIRQLKTVLILSLTKQRCWVSILQFYFINICNKKLVLLVRDYRNIDKQINWSTVPVFKDLKTFPNHQIKIMGTFDMALRCNDWKAKNVNIAVVEDGHHPIVARYLLALDSSTYYLGNFKQKCSSTSKH